MRTIIAGSRDLGLAEVITAMAVYHDRLKAPVTVVLCGMARGVDLAGRAWAKERNIPVEAYKADWNKHGKSAGPIRNQQMAEKAERLVAVWDGKSPGTANMITTALKLGVHTMLYLQPNEAGTPFFYFKTLAQFTAMREALARKESAA